MVCILPGHLQQGPSFVRIEDPLLPYESLSKDGEEESPHDSGIGSCREDSLFLGIGSSSAAVDNWPLTGPVISFRDVQYEVQIPVRGTLCKTVPKKILHNVG